MKQNNLIIKNLELAIWSIFPTIEHFRNFRTENMNLSIINRFIDLAHQKGLIPQKTERDFGELVNQCSERYKDHRPSSEYTFDILVKDIKKKTSVKKLVAELRILAEQFGFWEPDEVLFTRFKQDFHINSIKKQHALMLLSIWLSLNIPDLGLNYKSFLSFPRTSSEATEDETLGVMAAFSFIGENIDSAMIEFVKKELPKCIKDLNIVYLNEKRIHYLATACTARFPLKENVPGFPNTYAEAIRDALSLAYQMTISWQLSPLYNALVHFIVVLDAGPFEKVTITIKDLLNPELPTAYPIRLSHFVFTVAEQAELRVVFKNLNHPNIWAVEHFWAFPYFKSPPVLMPAETSAKAGSEWLPVRSDAAMKFRNALFYGDTKDVQILSIINQYPPKILSSLEIVNILTLRRFHHEAVHLLSSVLSLDPTNCIARTLRLRNFMFLANMAKDFEVADFLYERGVYDGEYIESNCAEHPEFYSEFSLIFWSKAIKIIRQLRKGNLQEEDIEQRKSEVLECLYAAEHYAKKGMAVSRAGLYPRCTFWMLYFIAFRHLIERNPELMDSIDKPMTDVDGIYVSASKPILEGVGWLIYKDDGISIDEAYLDKRMSKTIDTYLKSISETAFYVDVLYFIGVTIWDFSTPVQRKRIINRVLLLFEMAIKKAAELKQRCLGVYTMAPTYPVIQSPEEFISFVGKAKSAVEEIKRTGNYETGLIISLMHFDEECGAEPITSDLIDAEEKRRS